MTTLFSRLFSKQLNSLVEQRVKLILTDRDGFYEQTSGIDKRDRESFDREEILRQCLEAWRFNPIARHIVTLTSQFVVGGGVSVSVKDTYTNKYLQSFWDHRLNQMATALTEWCDELSRSGDLFLLISSDVSGMSFVRAIPAIFISKINTSENDIRQEVSYQEKDKYTDRDFGKSSGRLFPAYNPLNDQQSEGGAFPSVMLHYSINRPAGGLYGESDLSSILKWLSRYTAWLEDRVRLNKFRQTFLFIVNSKFQSEADRAARQATLNANPPTPGSILVADESEKWDVINPELDSFDANLDGLAIKKMIATGSAFPLHFLSEPESSTRTTAESSSVATFRHFEHRQQYFVLVLKDLIKVILTRRSLVDHKIIKVSDINVKTLDISARDNSSLANAAQAFVNAFNQLHEKGLISDSEFIRLAYRFAGEVLDTDQAIPLKKPIRPAPSDKKPIKSDGT
jgi:hypothetical protein